MGLVYFPTFTIKINHPWIGKYTISYGNGGDPITTYWDDPPRNGPNLPEVGPKLLSPTGGPKPPGFLLLEQRQRSTHQGQQPEDEDESLCRVLVQLWMDRAADDAAASWSPCVSWSQQSRP